MGVLCDDFIPPRAWATIPEHMVEATRRYIERGIPPGGFLTAVICNDLVGAVARADEINAVRLVDWVRFFHMYAPATCWGDEYCFDKWVEAGGLSGMKMEKGDEDARRTPE